MVDNACRCVSNVVRVISERHDPDTGDIQREEVLRPECLGLGVSPSLTSISVKSVDGDETGKWVEVSRHMA